MYIWKRKVDEMNEIMGLGIVTLCDFLTVQLAKRFIFFVGGLTQESEKRFPRHPYLSASFAHQVKN